MLRDLMVSRVRVKVLQAFLSQPKDMFYVRQLVREIGEEINAIRRELARLSEAGILKKEARGNRLYYWFNRNYLFWEDLLSMTAKTTGLGGKIAKRKNRLGKIRFAMLSGRFARRLPPKENSVDLLLVGEVVLPELAKIIREEEKQLEREINYTVMSKEEFEFRKKRRDPFLVNILGSSRIMVIGDEEELVSGQAENN